MRRRDDAVCIADGACRAVWRLADKPSSFEAGIRRQTDGVIAEGHDFRRILATSACWQNLIIREPCAHLSAHLPAHLPAYLPKTAKTVIYAGVGLFLGVIAAASAGSGDLSV